VAIFEDNFLHFGFDFAGNIMPIAIARINANLTPAQSAAD
jgi:hypothetical protein